MGLYQRQIAPRLINRVCASSAFDRDRSLICAGLTGTVVEVGFGAGNNLRFYPPTVTKVYAVEPSEVSRREAAKRFATSSTPVELVGLDGQSLQLADDSCDAALMTFTLCTIEDPLAALRELHRVVRPGGRLHVLEHGRSPDAKVAAWQRRLEPLEIALADGCHLTRDPVALLTDAGFVTVTLDQHYAKGPKPWAYLTRIVVERPAS
ncbi:MAG: class I SAM-dependent methyltransferase [Acidobacteriota bacterium]|nr:class I SAM-dependent methyltransferase [Acidobacteriota bacterium]MDE3043620.1 class I SAM-dependent methyltransferase [Acidobacteriota bacterium]MDE3106950.1 class I SAM-dependent methyltransferase [Acidobacteriota bacterium]MDE3222266.1 class I SAM-dependent methyltransferase [Acidobacteriota bacterium]